jgi:hypothetical protein
MRQVTGTKPGQDHYEKINILFSIIAIRDFKSEFDTVFRRFVERVAKKGDQTAEDCVEMTISRFPSLHTMPSKSDFIVTQDVAGYFDLSETHYSGDSIKIAFRQGKAREEMIEILSRSEGMTISKILNTQGFSLRDLGMSLSVLAPA